MNKLEVNFSQGIKRAAIVMIHGNSSSKDAFNSIFDSQLSSFTLLSVELPGHGDSPKSNNPKVDYTPTEVKKRLAYTINSYAFEELFIIGHSLGGHFAIEIAEEIDNLKGMILFGTPPIKRPINIQEAFLDYPHTNSYFIGHVSDDDIFQTISGLTKHENALKNSVDYFKQTDPNFREILALSLDQFSDETEVLQRLEFPIRILHGKDDRIINLGYLRKLEKDGLFEITEIEDCGHYPNMECPDRLTELIQKEILPVFRS